MYAKPAKPTEPAKRSQTTSSPANELHIFDSTTSATSLIIQNNNQIVTSNITQGTSTSSVTTGTSFIADFAGSTAPSVHELVSGSTTERIMIFRTANTNHTFTIPSGGLNCDILMIGGGGAGSGGSGNGSGAGACIVAINQTLPAGSCIVNVGAGGAYAGGNLNNNGSDSFITVANSDRYRAKGGGCAVNGYGIAGINGGCGGASGFSGGAGIPGGAAVDTNVVSLNNGTTRTTAPSIDNTHLYAVMGNAGSGSGPGNGTVYTGGGGIGTAGTPGSAGNGRFSVTINGTEYIFRTHFANGGNSFGVLNSGDGQYYIGGGGAFNMTGGLGGGSSYGAAVGNTGSGGGPGSSGGSGIVIIRYRSGTSTTTYTHTPTITTTLSTPTLGTPSIELVRGTQGDANRDYKIGNYEGDFIVKSSVSNSDSDYLRLSGANGNTFNFTNSLNWNQTSDRRIKENIMRASYDLCYNNIDKLELNRFNYIKEFNTGNKDINQLGFIAQEIKEIFPKAVFTNNYNSVDLSIPDMLSIDIGQINFTLYGAVKKLMEINKDKELRLKRLECLLNVESGSDGSDGSGDNVVIDSDVSIDTSNIVIDTSNIVIDTSNITIDTSNIAIDTSNITIDTSNIVIDTSNIVIDTSNIAIDTSNIAIDTSNIAIDTSNITIDTSNIILDTSDIVLDTSNLLETSNITIDTSNIVLDTSNIVIDTSNIVIDTSNI